MKKIVFWLITDILFYLFFLPLSFIIVLFHIKSFQLGSGEAGGGSLILLFVFVIINCFFILFQWFHTILSEKNKHKYLKRKVIIFIIHSVLLFILDIFLEFVTAFKDDNRSFDWLLGLMFFVAVSNIIYYYMVKELGKKLKWGGENE